LKKSKDNIDRKVKKINRTLICSYEDGDSVTKEFNLFEEAIDYMMLIMDALSIVYMRASSGSSDPVKDRKDLEDKTIKELGRVINKEEEFGLDDMSFEVIISYPQYEEYEGAASSVEVELRVIATESRKSTKSEIAAARLGIISKQRNQLALLKRRDSSLKEEIKEAEKKLNDLL
jgi:hypothetical protein